MLMVGGIIAAVKNIVENFLSAFLIAFKSSHSNPTCVVFLKRPYDRKIIVEKSSLHYPENRRW